MPPVIIAFRKAKGRHKWLQQKHVPLSEHIFDNRYKERRIEKFCLLYRIEWIIIRLISKARPFICRTVSF